MATLKDRHYIRKIRKGNNEFLISVSTKLLNELGLSEGDFIDLRNLKKSEKK